MTAYLPPLPGVFAAVVLGLILAALVWWNRAQVRLDAGRLRPEDYEPVPYVEPMVGEAWLREPSVADEAEAWLKEVS